MEVDKMMNLVLRFITFPMAVQVFKQDKDQFQKSKVYIIYFNLIDSILEKMQEDFNQLKAEMYSKHHLDVRYLGKENGMVKYTINKEEIGFSPNELRDNTEKLMREYLINAEIKSEELIWKN